MTMIINWKHKFYNRILERGESYYKRGLVFNYTETQDAVMANVGNNSEYLVRILHNNGSITKMFCTCPYASDGLNCKHMAALLFRNNKENASSDKPSVVKKIPVVKKQPVLIKPFSNPNDNTKYFFDMSALTADYQFYDTDYNKALKLIEDGSVKTAAIEEQYDDGLYLSGQFVVNRYYTLQCVISHDKINRLECQNRECYWRYGSFSFLVHEKKPCIHEIAALILMYNYITANNPGDFTNAAAKTFIEKFSDLTPPDETRETISNVIIEPRLEYGLDDTLSVSFRTGNQKLYVIKSLSSFINAYENSTMLSLSYTGQLDFSRFRIVPQDEDLYRFIYNAVKEEEYYRLSMNRNTHYYYDLSVKTSLPLFGRRLDEFYELVKDRKVSFNDKRSGNKTMLSFAQKDPEISLQLTDYRIENEFAGLRLSGEVPEYLEGNRYLYYLSGNTLFRSSGDYRKMTAIFDGRSQIEYVIGKKHLAQFYNHILPKLKDQVNIETLIHEDVSQYLPVQAKFAFYFDVRDGIIYCLANVIYGEETLNLIHSTASDQNNDYYAENEIREFLNKYLSADPQENVYTSDTDDSTITAIINEAIPFLMKKGDVHTTAAFDRLGQKKKINFNIGVKIDNDLLALDIATDDIPIEELAAVISSYRLKKKYHKLKDGQLIRIDDESIESISDMFERLNIPLKQFVSGKLNIPAYRALYLDSLLTKNEYFYEKRDRHFKELISDFQNIEDIPASVPSNLQGIIRPYQIEGFRWLKTLSRFGFGGILADEMGLGKTLQIVAVLQDHKDSGGSKVSLVVCPSSLIYNWIKEIQTFSKDLIAIPVVGSKADRAKIIASHQDYDVMITSYDLLRRDISLYEDITFDYKILDEAQYIKTYSTANAKTCKAINARHNFAMTGTPIENNLSELWSIFDFLMPGFLYRYEEFRNTFENRIVTFDDKQASEDLKQMIAPFILRRKKTDVLKDLPQKIEETISVRFESKQQRLYDSEVLKISSGLNDVSEQSFRTNKIKVLAELTRIRQICCEPSLVFEDYNGESAKKEACLELIRNAIAEGHKILLFSQFTSMLEILEEELDKDRISYYKITGQTEKQKRLQMVEAFNSDDTPLFLISLKAGGTGLNLTGADIVIHYDPWWNVAAQNQATDRAHRIGQEKIVTVYKIIAAGTIEEKIIELQEKKSELVESIITGDNVSISALTKEDLLKLLS